MKFGLDIHGVISSDARFWSKFTRLLVNSGHEVHILTGPPLGHEVLGKLKRWQIHYTHIFSIVDYHQKLGTVMWQDSQERWCMDPTHWDPTKAQYCQENGIDLCIDDSPVYGDFFTTAYAQYKAKRRGGKHT